MKYFLVCIVVLLFVLGCEKYPPNANDDNNKPLYQPVAVIQNPLNGTTVYDSAYIQVLVFFRGHRSVSLYINDALKHTVNSDTLKYKWIVKDFPKFSKHRLYVEVSSGEEDTLTAEVRATVTVSHPMVAFSSNNNGSYQTYIMNEDGTQLRQITNESGDVYFPAWSPAGDKIAYILKQNNKYSINIYDLIDSSTSRFLEADSTEVMQDLVWSSFSNRLAFSNNGKIVVIDPDKVKRDVISTGFYNRHPSFGKNDEIFFEYGTVNKYLAVNDTSNQLSGIDAGSYSGDLVVPIQKTNSSSMYCISLSTRDLVYSSLVSISGGWKFGSFTICMSNVDTTSYAFSPNGKKIAVIGRADNAVYVIPFNGGTPQRVYQGGVNQSLSWSKK
jgi:dipeptidyl aminopeptidase/acylaminoacyl peptidase